MRLTVLTILGTRPEIIRLSRIINLLNKFCNHILVHSGQNYDYELNEIFFEELKIQKPDFFLGVANDKLSPPQMIGKIIIEVDKIIERINPDAIVILGDTNTSLSAISAKRRKIPIFHLEAGNRCFDYRVPEEINRKIVDHISDINITYSDIAREYLLREGFPANQIIKVGSPMFEVIEHHKKEIQQSKILEDLGLNKEKYFVISAHREDNIENYNNFNKLINLINSLYETYNLPIIFSTHPRTLKKFNEHRIKFDEKIIIAKPFGFFDYLHLQCNAKTVLSDSGTINEEASILNFKALNIRESFERPEAMEEGATMLVGLDLERIYQGLSILESQNSGETRNLKMVDDYNVTNVSEKIVRIIHSYVSFVDNEIWKK